MLNTKAQDKQLEAFCKGCNSTLLVNQSQLNQKFVCKFCGYSSILSKEILIHSHPTFARKNEELNKKPKLNHSFSYYRHGADQAQKGILMNLQTNEMEFVTKTKLVIASKISFMLKDKKFIVTIQSSKSIPSSNGTDTLYSVTASFEIVVAMTKRSRNPHYLIK